MIYNSFLCSHFGTMCFCFRFLIPNSGQGLLFSVLTLPTWEKVKWLTASVSHFGTEFPFFCSHFPELGLKKIKQRLIFFNNNDFPFFPLVQVSSHCGDIPYLFSLLRQKVKVPFLSLSKPFVLIHYHL